MPTFSQISESREISEKFFGGNPTYGNADIDGNSTPGNDGIDGNSTPGNDGIGGTERVNSELYEDLGADIGKWEINFEENTITSVLLQEGDTDPENENSII